MSAASGILLGIQVADCVPVLVADTRQRVVAAFHAGWRGTVSGIVRDGVAKMRSQFGSKPEDLIGAVGPSIGGCCYTVGEEVREKFHEAYPYAPELFDARDTGLHLDLAEANRRQLLAAGLASGTMTVVGECTACTRLPDGRRKYFSHRAENGFTGRAMGMIGIVNP
jgi:YfiH family protein